LDLSQDQRTAFLDGPRRGKPELRRQDRWDIDDAQSPATEKIFAGSTTDPVSGHIAFD
jgi:hypothetical protein